MEPKFNREIKTRPLDEDDYDIIVGSVRHVDEHGREYTPTLAELNATGMSRVTAARDINTGEWRTKPQSKTHDGKELPFFVVRAGG
jgi:hypothetical protein